MRYVNWVCLINYSKVVLSCLSLLWTTVSMRGGSMRTGVVGASSVYFRR